MITTATSGTAAAPRTEHPHSARATTALVVGGTGAVGAGVVRALLGAGARVLVPSRGGARLAGLRAAVGAAGADRLSGVEADLGTLHGAATVRERVEAEYGRLDALITALGPRPPCLTDPYGPAPSFPRVLDDTLTAHFVTAATFLPQLAAQGVGSYTVVSGSVPGAGHDPGVQALSLAGLLLLVRAFRQEARATGIRVNVVTLGAGPASGRRGLGFGPGGVALPAADVGALVAALSDPRSAVDGEEIHVGDRHALRAALARVRRRARADGGRSRAARPPLVRRQSRR